MYKQQVTFDCKSAPEFKGKIALTTTIYSLSKKYCICCILSYSSCQLKDNYVITIYSFWKSPLKNQNLALWKSELISLEHTLPTQKPRTSTQIRCFLTGIFLIRILHGNLRIETSIVKNS